jgi:hypothetical protein
LPKKKVYLGGMSILSILLSLESRCHTLDSISWGGGDAQVSQQGTKPTGRDRGFSTEGFPFVSISVQLLALIVTQGRVLFVVFIFIVDVVVLLLLLLLSRCALSCRATRYTSSILKGSFS